MAAVEARYVLTDASDLRALRHKVHRLRWWSRATVVVRAPSMDPRAQDRWGRRLTFWLHACGCLPGGMVALGAIVWRSILAMDQPPRTIASAATHLAWILGAAVAGKAAGLLTARVLFVVDLARLGRYLSAPSTTRVEVQR